MEKYRIKFVDGHEEVIETPCMKFDAGCEKVTIFNTRNEEIYRRNIYLKDISVIERL